MASTRGLDRMVFFTDAITAIAITLLILPLSDSVTGAVKAGVTPARFLADNGSGLLAFALSFAVIARLWIAHHAAFEHVKAYSGLLLVLNMAWAMTVVFLPLPTEMYAQFPSGPVTVAIYIGTMAVSSIILSVIVLVVRKHPQLELESHPVGRQSVTGHIATTVGIVVALIVGVLVPVINIWAMFILLLTGPAQRIFVPKERARHAD